MQLLPGDEGGERGVAMGEPLADVLLECVHGGHATRLARRALVSMLTICGKHSRMRGSP